MKRGFDYYIFIDYSEDIIGYIALDKQNIKNCLCKINKLKHYKELKHKREYLKSIKKVFQKDNILECLDKHRITELRHNIELCSEVFDLCKNRPKSNIFISIDDRQYKGFMKLINILDEKRFTIVKECKLKKNSEEYKLSLIIDTLLNIKRVKDEKELKMINSNEIGNRVSASVNPTPHTSTNVYVAFVRSRPPAW